MKCYIHIFFTGTIVVKIYTYIFCPFLSQAFHKYFTLFFCIVHEYWVSIIIIVIFSWVWVFLFCLWVCKLVFCYCYCLLSSDILWLVFWLVASCRAPYTGDILCFFVIFNSAKKAGIVKYTGLAKSNYNCGTLLLPLWE